MRADRLGHRRGRPREGAAHHERGPYKNSVEHKYSYSGVQYKPPPTAGRAPRITSASGSSTRPSNTSAAAPPSRNSTATFGDNDNPTRSSSITGKAAITTPAPCNIAAGEEWSKVIGPIFVYVNSLDQPKTPSQATLDTLAAPPVTRRSRKLDGQRRTPCFRRPRPGEKGNREMALRLGQRRGLSAQRPARDRDRANRARRPAGAHPSTKLPHLTVGLAHPDGGTVQWIHDAKYYQFWNDGRRRQIHHHQVRPGTYTLHAFADGVLGDFAQANITVEAGKSLDLGKLDWKPVRYGRQLWDIGYPTAPAANFSRATAPITGCGAGTCVTPCCSRTTSPTPSAKAITTRTGSSRRCRTRRTCPSSIPPPRTPRTSASAGSRRNRSPIPANQHARTMGHLRHRPGDRLDHQVQHGQGRCKAPPSCAWRWPASTPSPNWPSRSTARASGPSATAAARTTPG
jgi:hypothetical protein